MTLSINDLKYIGVSTYENKDGTTNFECNGDTANIEFLLLREILDTQNYRIEGTADCKEEGDILYQTNLPWEQYSKVLK